MAFFFSFSLKNIPPFPLLCFLIILPSCHSLTCTSQKFTNNKIYDRCNDLPTLGSYLHWAVDPKTSSLSVAFIATPARPDGWVSWAINPTGTGMAGSQAFVAFRDSSSSVVVKTFNISSYTSIVPSKLSFDVTEAKAEYSNGLIKIFATLALPEKGMTTVNQVWQVGSSVVNGFPARHEFQPANLNAKGTLDLLSGQSTGTTGNSRTRKRNIHGILNTVSWGILFPVGVIIARYVRAFPGADPAWFYSHISCQLSAYAIGVAGWATGLKLGSESKGVRYTTHRNLGIALFSLATVQIFALFLRPKKDHKYRYYWNIYHHGTGYAVIILGILNVFKGLDILNPADKWRTTYIVVISVLGLIAVLLEAFTWFLVSRQKSSKPAYNNGESKQQPLAP